MQKTIRWGRVLVYPFEPWDTACKGHISDPVACCKDTLDYRPATMKKPSLGGPLQLFGGCLFFSCVLPAVAELVSVFETISFLASETIHCTPETNG